MPSCTRHSQVLHPFSRVHTSRQLLVSLPQTQVFTGREEHVGQCILNEPKENTQSCKQGALQGGYTTCNCYTKNKEFKETYNPTDSHLQALKLDEMFYLLSVLCNSRKHRGLEASKQNKTEKWEERKG